MSCGCKTKKNKTSNVMDVPKELKAESSNLMGDILKSVGVTIIATLAMPFIYIIMVVAIFKGNIGGGLDIGKLISSLISKKESTPDVFDEEITNPEDYEMVGVEKII